MMMVCRCCLLDSKEKKKEKEERRRKELTFKLTFQLLMLSRSCCHHFEAPDAEQHS